jgi:insecticidal toxin
MWNYLPGATSRHDYGFDVLRRIAKGGDFVFDFFRIPTHWLIDRITHEYVPTIATISLTARSLRLQVPPLPNALSRHLSYELRGAGADYAVGLDACAGVTLASAVSSTRWILDGRTLSPYRVEVASQRRSVDVSGITVVLADANFAAVFVLTSRGETLQVDFAGGGAFPVEIAAGSFPGGSAGVDQHLQELELSHRLQGQYVVVDDYSVAYPGSDTLFQGVGRAYYEVATRRMLFTWDAPQELSTAAELAGMVGDDAYFYNLERQALWRVNARTSVCEAKYNALFSSTQRQMDRLWVQGKSSSPPPIP